MSKYADHYRERVNELLRNMIVQNGLAEAADKRVQTAKSEIRQMYARKSNEQTRNKMKVDYILNDALDDYRYRSGEVTRISAVIQGICAAVELLDR